MKDNPVAKNAHKFNKRAAGPHKDKKKAMKKGDRKHKGSYESVDEVLKVSDGASAWIKDFQSSDAPQFKGKSMDKRKEMAIAAYLDAKKGSKEESMNEKKGLWDRIHAKRKRGEKPAKPGEKGYPKTLDVGEGLKQARQNVGADSCWPGYKATGTKMKGGKEVPDCKKEGVDEAVKVGDKVKFKKGIDPKIARGYQSALNKSGKVVKDYGDGDVKVNFGGNDDRSVDAKLLVKESAQDRLSARAAKHGLGKPNKAADDYMAKMRKKYGAKDLADLKKKMGMKEEVVSELTQKDLERLAKRKQKNLVKRGKAKPEPRKPRQAGAGRVSNVGAGKSEADDNLIMQLRKAQDLKGNMKVKFRGGEKKLPLSLINKLLATYDKAKTPADKKKVVMMTTHNLRKSAGLDNSTPSASDKAMAKFQKSRSRGIPAPRGGSKGPSDKELRDIERGK